MTVDDISEEKLKVEGDSTADTLNASTNDDHYINGFAKNDQLFGKAGHDDILGGDGDDKIYAGAGADKANGEEGKDQIYG